MKSVLKIVLASFVMMLACGSLRAADREEMNIAPAVDASELMLLLEQQRYVPVDTQVLIDDFFRSHRRDFKAMDMRQILDELEEMTPRQTDIVLDGFYFNPTLMTVVSAFTGMWGVDRMLLGDVGLGILKLITGGGVGIWWMVDMFTTSNRTKERNYEEYCELANYAMHIRSAER